MKSHPFHMVHFFPVSLLFNFPWDLFDIGMFCGFKIDSLSFPLLGKSFSIESPDFYLYYS